jgi:hypothetical protein
MLHNLESQLPPVQTIVRAENPNRNNQAPVNNRDKLAGNPISKVLNKAYELLDPAKPNPEIKSMSQVEMNDLEARMAQEHEVKSQLAAERAKIRNLEDAAILKRYKNSETHFVVTRKDGKPARDEKGNYIILSTGVRSGR